MRWITASVDSMASIGFVKFQIKQKPGNTMGTRIENGADIVFDFNSAIRTNTVFNTIGWPVVISVDLAPEAAAVKIYPNPTTGEVWQEGDFFAWPSLGATLQRVAENGGDEFRTGQTAVSMIDDMQAAGGRMSLQDLQDYT